MTTTDLETSLSKMQTYLETPAGLEPQDLLDRIEYLNILIAKSGQLLAQAKFIQDAPGEIFDLNIPELRDDEKFDFDGYLAADYDF